MASPTWDVLEVPPRSGVSVSRSSSTPRTALSRDVRGTAVHRLEHGREPALGVDVPAGRQPHTDACLEWLVQNRWPEGISCPKCERVTKHHKITGRPVYACDNCGHHVSPMAGTIMEHSSTSMRLWFYAMYLMASTRCGIAAKQLERELGVTYKTAWRIFKQIRSMLAEDITLEGSSVEVDATFVGGKAKNMHKSKRELLGGVELSGRRRFLVWWNGKGMW